MTWPDDYVNKILCGESLEAMKGMPDNSVDSIVTDPPAGISFMGKQWDRDKGGRDQWISWLQEIMAEALRVLKPGGHALVWALPRTSHWTATALEDAGFEIRDCVYHVFGSGFPKSLDIGKSIDKQAGAEREVIGISDRGAGASPQKLLNHGSGDTGIGILDGSGKNFNITSPSSPEAQQWDGWGTALKPATEIWLLCRKPLTSVPNGDIVGADNQIRRLLCQLSPVKFAEGFSTLSPSVLREATSGFAQWLADVLSMEKQEKLSEEMGMFRSPEEGKTFLSIVLLWSNIWVENLKRENRYTTLTTTVLTTELKTLNLLTSLITQAIMPDRLIRTDGSKQSVKIVEELLIAVVATLKNILTLIAPEIATELGIYPAKSENEISEENETKKVGLSEYPAVECWWLCRKPLSEKTVAANVLKWGTGGINIDGCRVGNNPGYKYNADKNGTTFHGEQGERIKRTAEKCGSEIIESTKGRWPAHLVHDGSEEVLAEFPNSKSGFMKADTKRNSDGGYHGGFPSDRVGERDTYGDSGSASRFFYTAKASKSERGEDNKHPTVKPLSLMEYLIKLITPPGGTVLDLFAGSGSTLVAAVNLGFKFVGIELDPEYCGIAEARVRAAQKTKAEEPKPNGELFE